MVCSHCQQEMGKVDGCTLDRFDHFADGTTHPRIRYGNEYCDWTPTRRCHDCGAAPGHFHHYFCDNETCPRCGEQAISCDCSFTADPVPSWTTPPWPLYCHDCGGDCAGELYMVHDDLWPLEPHGGILCVACLEQRIGRPLTRRDFALDAGSWPDRDHSPRLRARLNDPA